MASLFTLVIFMACSARCDDFPLLGNEGAASFLADSYLDDEDRAEIAHGNADKLLGLG